VSDADRRASNFLTGITYLRVALVPVIMALVLAGDRVRYAFALGAALFAIAAVTDFFDGFLARRWAKATTLGSFLDTTADKLLVSGALVALVAVGRASVWIAFLIIGRELVILGLRGAVAAAGEVMRPSIWGKLKTNAQFLAITLAR
jgi:CDP-diacylglycerol--glycerol-3-phosphate 3-phosphatidyltransferase